MQRLVKATLLFAFFMLLASCGGGALRMSVNDMLKLSGRDRLPTQEDYPDHGAVILYEENQNRLYLDSEWDINVEENYYRALLYLNDKAEDFATQSIYVGQNYTLLSFSARTIKKNGEVLILTEKDLHPTQLKPDFVEFSDDKSVKFTFPGVEPGAILEFSYRLNRRSFFGGDIWAIQSSVPKLYTKYSMELPHIFFVYQNNWNYSAFNIELDQPQSLKNVANQESRKNASQIYYWELVDIPALKRETQMPPYRESAQYVSVDVKWKDWHELSKNYWKKIVPSFQPSDQNFYKNLAGEIIGNAENDSLKIARIFNYTQQNYRYVAVNIGESGYVPHPIDLIYKNKYGDCKDMTVLNVILLRSLGFEAFPALVNTKDKGQMPENIISLDYNHMIAFVRDKSGKEYWLDATGSSCPLGEIYSGIEGVSALVIYFDGTSEFKKIPKSVSTENAMTRRVKLYIADDGAVKGEATLTFTGNENLDFRSSFKDASKGDMRKFIESYVNSNTPDLKIDSLNYDDPSKIENSFHINLWFKKERLGSLAGNLLIFKPAIFTLSSVLDRFRDEVRKFPIVFYDPYKTIDIVEINFDEKQFSIESVGRAITENPSFASFNARAFSDSPGKIIFKRDYIIKKEQILPADYQSWRNIHKAIAAANEENIVLKKR